MPLRSGGGSPLLTRRSLLNAAGLAAASVGAGAVVSACGGSGGNGPTGGRGSIPLTFLTVTPLSLGFSPEMVAQADGHFAANDLNVTLEATRGSAQAIQQVLAGNALMTRIGNIETMIGIAGRGAQLVNVGALLQGDALRILSSAERPIRGPQDFVGKLIGIPSEGGTSELTLDMVVQAGGIDPSTIERQIVGLTPGVFELVLRGDIDAYFVGSDVAVQVQDMYDNAVSFDPSTVIAMGQSYATSRPALEDPNRHDIVGRYMRSVSASVQSIVDDQNLDRTLDLLAENYSAEVDMLSDRELARQALTEIRNAWLAAGRENLLTTVPERWQAVYRQLVDAGEVPGGLDPSQWYTNEFSPQQQ